MLKKFSARIDLSDDVSALKVIGKEITPQIKAQMLPADVAVLRERYQARENQISHTEPKPDNADKTEPDKLQL